MNRGTGTGLIAFGWCWVSSGRSWRSRSPCTRAGSTSTRRAAPARRGDHRPADRGGDLGDRQQEELDNCRERPEHTHGTGARRGAAGLGHALDPGPAAQATRTRKPGPKAEALLPGVEGGNMLAAVGGVGVVGVIVVVLIVLAIIFFVRRR